MTNNNEKKSRYISSDPEKRARQLANLRPDAAIKHGGYQRSKKDFFDEQEQKLFDEMVAEYKETYELSLPADIDLLEMAIKSYIKAQRQDRWEYETGKPVGNRARDHQAQFLQFIQALGLDRRFMLSTNHKDNFKQIDLALLFTNDEELNGDDYDE